LVAYSGDERRQELELDGCLVELTDGGGVEVTLVEAKRKARRARRAAERQLHDLLRKIGVQGGTPVRSKANRRLAWAWVTFSL
jgi:hypothetical protein